MPAGYLLLERREVCHERHLISCPETGRPVPTGLITDTIILENLPPVAVPLRQAGKGRPDVERNTLPCSDRDADISIDICRAGSG
jgi:hypothetical protein